jgi:RNA polymerase sigma factor (sigma-70 family)
MSKIKLTPEQKAVAEDYMRRYPRPIAPLRKAFFGSYRRAKLLGASDDDINQICCLGVIRATRTYDDSKSSFDTYAVSKARGEVMWWCEAQTRMKRTTILPTLPIKEDIVGTPMEDNQSDLSDELQITQYLRCLSERQRWFLVQHYGIGTRPLKFDELAIIAGISRQRVHQICQAAIEKIRRRVWE